MSFADKLISQKELDRLGEVIAQAEKKTSGEIRLMIVKKSSKLPDLTTKLTLLFAVLFMLYCWFNRDALIFRYHQWRWMSGAEIVGLAVLLSSIFLASIFSRFEFVQRLLTPNDVLEEWVWLRTELEFHREGLSRTKDRTGILILLSLFERRAVVMGDKGINEKIDKGVWDEVVTTVIDGVNRGQLADHLTLAIQQCGNLLAKYFPAQSDDQNELCNSVIVKE